MAENSELEKKLKLENFAVDIRDFYMDKEISNFMKDFINVNLKKFLLDLNNYAECGDWKNCTLLIEKLNILKFILKHANEEYKIKLADIIIQKLLPNIYLYLQFSINDLIEILYYTLKYITNYHIDWKFFYTLFNITESGELMTEYKYKFFISLHRFYSEDSIKIDEYKILVKTFFDDLLNSRTVKAIHNFIYFLPKKYIVEDDKLQLRLLYLMKNKQSNFFDCCCLFHKIIRKNGKLYFSKEPEKNKEYTETFIKYYFTFLNLYISNDPRIKKSHYESPIPILNSDEKDAIKFEKSVVCILIELLFNPNFKSTYSLVESHLTLILNNRHLLLKEKSDDSITKNYINFLQTLIYGINRLFHDKHYDKNLGKFRKTLKNYEENKILYDRLLVILKYLSLNLEKLFLYDNRGCCIVLKTLFQLIVSSKPNSDYMKKLLEYLNFEAYLNILQFLKENETKIIKYIMKLHTIMPLLLSEYLFTNYKKVKELIKDSIKFLGDNINSADQAVDILIFQIFFLELFKLKDLSIQNKIYEFLIPIITEATEKIMKNLLVTFGIVAKRNYFNFLTFILAMKKFLGKESLNKISSLYASYIENNEIENSNLKYYFLVINKEEHINLFNFMYDILLYKDNSINTEIKKNFIYPKDDKDYNFDISKCSIEVFGEKQLERYQDIFSFLDYSVILTKDEMIKKFYELYFSLMNQKGKKFQKFGIRLFGFVINSILESKVNEENNLIEYPNDYHLNIAIQMFEKIILPYEKEIIAYMENNPKNLKDNKEQEIEKEKKNNVSDKLALEELVENYMRLVHKVNNLNCNIFLNFNFEQENLYDYKLIEHQIKLYKKYKTYLNNSLGVIFQIYEYNGGITGNYLFSNYKTNTFFDKILTIKLKEMSKGIGEKKSYYRKINKMILLSNSNFFREIYMLNKTNIFNINNLEIIKIMMPKEESYYTFLKLYLLSYNSVTLPKDIISSSQLGLYSNNDEKIKKIFNDIYDIFISELEKIKNDSFEEQNIMNNIGNTFIEISSFYIEVLPYDAMLIIEKIIRIIYHLKLKKFKKIDNFIFDTITDMACFLEKVDCIEKDKRYNLYSKINEIIEYEMNKIYKLSKENNKKNIYVTKYLKIIETFIDNSLNILCQTESDINKKDSKYNIITHPEKLLFYELLVDYALVSLDTKSELYRKLIQFALNNLIIHKSSVSVRILWLKQLYYLIWEEYGSYENYEWIIFKSDEEYLNYWNKLKYEVDGRLYIPYPCERIRRIKFVFDECINNNLQYNINLEELLKSMAEVDEYQEDQKHIAKYKEKEICTLDEILSQKVNEEFDKIEGIDFELGKMFYCMFKLKYIDINSEYVSKINYSTEFFNESGKKINHPLVIYEFLLGKYEYLAEKKLLGIKEKEELWKILEKFTGGINKTEDKIICNFFSYIFQNFSLGDVEFILDYNFHEYHILFVAKIYECFCFHFKKLLTEVKVFNKKKTEGLITRIFSNEKNLITTQNYLNSILTIYYNSNGMIKYNYYTFKNECTKELHQYYIQVLEKSDTKYKRYGLFCIYTYLFIFLNNDLSIMKASLQKMSLCSNEFKNMDKLLKNDKDKRIYKRLEQQFQRFIEPINFPSLCDMVFDLLQNENDSNETDKIIYLQTIDSIYKGQKHLNLFKYSDQEIFDCLFKVFASIKKDKLKNYFVRIFLDYFNSLTEEENKKFIEKYQKFIFEDIKKEEEQTKYNYIKILMIQLMRFKIKLPDYMQEFIIKLKIVNRKDNDKLKKIIIDSLKSAMNNYQSSYTFMKENISEECKDVLEEMTREKSYFI